MAGCLQTHRFLSLFFVFDARRIPPWRAGACNTLKEPAGGLWGILNKVKAKVRQDSGKFSVEFTVNKTIPEFNNGAIKSNLNWTHSFLEFKNMLQQASIKLPGSRSCTSSSQNRSIR